MSRIPTGKQALNLGPKYFLCFSKFFFLFGYILVMKYFCNPRNYLADEHLANVELKKIFFKKKL